MERKCYGKNIVDHFVFMKKFLDDNFIIVLLYVNDMLIVVHDTKKVQSLANRLRNSFGIKNLGPTQEIYGMISSLDRKKCKLLLF